MSIIQDALQTHLLRYQGLALTPKLQQSIKEDMAMLWGMYQVGLLGNQENLEADRQAFKTALIKAKILVI